jgi:hypothetical protein
MSDDTPDSLIPYDEIVQEALRAVVGRVLGEVQRGGGTLPGNHHFYITFKTHAPGVHIPQHLRERFGKGIAAYPLEPANSPTLRTGHKIGRHRIQGISDEFVPSIVKLGQLGRILDIWDGDAIVMSQRIANELGIAVGISSGANLLGALEIAHEQGTNACVATVFCDDNKKYLSTDLCSDEECKEHYRVNDVELLDFRVIAPVASEPAARA